eukprot:4739873-Prymnesium_polylepis.1
MSWLEAIFYRSLQSAFMSGFTACDPVAFLTTTVRNQCELRDYSAANHRQGRSRCSQLPVGYVGLFCKRGDPNVPFDLDRTLTFPDPNVPFMEVETEVKSDVSDFGLWVNWACMPKMAQALAYHDSMNAIEVSEHEEAEVPPDDLGQQLKWLIKTSSYRSGSDNATWSMLKK